MKYYSLFVHWKQGDELQDCVEAAKNDYHKALEDWSENFLFYHCRVKEIADALKDKNFEIDADTHHIGIAALDEDAEKACDQLVKDELIDYDEEFNEMMKEECEELDEDGCDCGECCEECSDKCENDVCGDNCPPKGEANGKDGERF